MLNSFGDFLIKELSHYMAAFCLVVVWGSEFFIILWFLVSWHQCRLA